MIDDNKLRRKLHSDDLIDHVDIHANVKPVLTELLDRLEVAEKDIALKERIIDSLGSTLNAVANERDALRAKVEEVEKQEPAFWGPQMAIRNRWDSLMVRLEPARDTDMPLYLAPGAQSGLNLACPSVQARLATQWGYVKKGDAQAAPSVPDESSAYAMGAKGGPVVEAERLAFEAWMKGHCWALNAEWDGNSYRGKAEIGQHTDYRAMQTRQLLAAWPDRAALAAAPKPEERL